MSKLHPSVVAAKPSHPAVANAAGTTMPFSAKLVTSLDMVEFPADDPTETKCVPLAFVSSRSFMPRAIHNSFDSHQTRAPSLIDENGVVYDKVGSLQFVSEDLSTLLTMSYTHFWSHVRLSSLRVDV